MTKFQSFDTPKFIDYYDNLDSFKADYDEFTTNFGKPIFNNDTTVDLLYFLLISRYGYSTVASYNFDMFRPMLFTKIWQYGPTWEKRVEIQDKLRSLSLDADSEIFKGGKAIYNTAFNDSSAPSTQSLEELTYINNQNTTNFKKSTLEGLESLSVLLETDVTEEFLDKFKSLFKTIIYTGNPLLYTTYIGDME